MWIGEPPYDEDSVSRTILTIGHPAGVFHEDEDCGAWVSDYFPEWA
jgi:hypothetical protein